MAVQSVHRLDDHKVVSAATVRLHVEVGVEPELDALKYLKKMLSKILLRDDDGWRIRVNDFLKTLNVYINVLSLSMHIFVASTQGHKVVITWLTRACILNTIEIILIRIMISLFSIIIACSLTSLSSSRCLDHVDTVDIRGVRPWVVRTGDGATVPRLIRLTAMGLD